MSLFYPGSTYGNWNFCAFVPLLPSLWYLHGRATPQRCIWSAQRWEENIELPEEFLSHCRKKNQHPSCVSWKLLDLRLKLRVGSDTDKLNLAWCEGTVGHMWPVCWGAPYIWTNNGKTEQQVAVGECIEHFFKCFRGKTHSVMKNIVLVSPGSCISPPPPPPPPIMTRPPVALSVPTLAHRASRSTAFKRIPKSIDSLNQPSMRRNQTN